MTVAGYPAVDDSFTGKFRYFVTHLITGEILEELPFSTMSYSRTKNRPGGWSATISHRHQKVTDSLLKPWTRGVYVARDDKILYGGILMDRSVGTDPMLKIGGAGFFEYYRENRRVIRSRQGMSFATGVNNYIVRFDQVDQFNIVKDLLNHATAFGGLAHMPYDAIRLNGPGVGGVTGRLRDRTYYTYERKGIGEAIEQMSEVIDGFDFSESYAWNGSRIERYFDLWYPRKGVDNPLLFEVGNNVILLNRDEVGGPTATRGVSTGSGDADAQMQSEAINLAAEYPTGPYPMMEFTTSYPDVSVRQTLNDHVAYDVIQRQSPPETIQLQINETSDQKLGSWDWGDSVTCYANDQGLQILDIYRIENYEVQINENGSITIKPLLALFGPSSGT